MGQMKQQSRKLGLALGSGSSRGWSHIGVIRELESVGIAPDVVCGCSIGSIVASSYAAGRLDKLEAWARSLGKRDIASFLELKRSFNGFVDVAKLRGFLAEVICKDGTAIEELGKTYASVATDLTNGREVWFTDGDVLDSVLASIALPALFSPVPYKGRWLVDGGLVNPVPISLCHAKGAERVIAVNLNGGIVGKHFVEPPEGTPSGGFVNALRTYSESLFPQQDKRERPPSLMDVAAGSLNIIQDRITRSRMAGDPPDILLNPRLAHIDLMAFDRADEAIEEGRACVRRMMPEIRRVLELNERS